MLALLLLSSCGGGDSEPANQSPTASNVIIIDINGGNALLGDALQGRFTYNDIENDAQGFATFRWLRDNVAIVGATSVNYIITAADRGQTLSFEVTPVAINGAISGTPVKSTNLFIENLTGEVTLSGTVTYTAYNPGQFNGLDYSNPIDKPVRGAIIELQNSTGTILDFGNTSSTGSYSLSAPVNAAVRIVVKAALGNTTAPNTTVIDNTNSDALYSLFINTTTGESDGTLDFYASSGWDGNNYSGMRAAAPFAILDVIYQAQQLVLSTDSLAFFPLLRVNWSENNKPAEGNLTDGDIGGPFYQGGKIYLLGAQNNNTDEYDAHVIAHEWGHYFQDKFSRSDSIGGAHGSNDILDLTVAFGEGFANALSGMIMNDPVYIDTIGSIQGISGLVMDMESDSISDTATDFSGLLLDGFYAESSIQEVVYDIYDSGNGDDDAIALGFPRIYNVMIKGHKNTLAFTSIFSFLSNLKSANTAVSSSITSLAAAENIGDGNEFEANNFLLYTPVPLDGSLITVDVDGDTLQTYETYGPITSIDSGNKLYNRLFFSITPSSSGCYTLTVDPTANGDMIIYFTDNRVLDNFADGIAENVSRQLSAGVIETFTVGSLAASAGFTVQLASTPNACP